MRIGYRYRPNRLAPEYDAIVIGSGMGGLTTAALLSELGWKICVLEQHYTAGGYTHSYDRAGYEWDVGVHYIGDVGTKTRTRRMFDFLSDGKLEWAPMDDEYDRFYIGDKVFCARAGKQEFRDNLVAQFPDEEQAIDRYMQLLTGRRWRVVDAWHGPGAETVAAVCLGAVSEMEDTGSHLPKNLGCSERADGQSGI